MKRRKRSDRTVDLGPITRLPGATGQPQLSEAAQLEQCRSLAVVSGLPLGAVVVLYQEGRQEQVVRNRRANPEEEPPKAPPPAPEIPDDDLPF